MLHSEEKHKVDGLQTFHKSLMQCLFFAVAVTSSNFQMGNGLCNVQRPRNNCQGCLILFFTCLPLN